MPGLANRGAALKRTVSCIKFQSEKKKDIVKNGKETVSRERSNLPTLYSEIVN